MLRSAAVSVHVMNVCLLVTMLEAAEERETKGSALLLSPMLSEPSALLHEQNIVRDKTFTLLHLLHLLVSLFKSQICQTVI